MQCGYPRFFVHPIIQKLVLEVLRRHGNPDVETATAFPSVKTARVCSAFLLQRSPPEVHFKIRLVNFVPSSHAATTTAVTPRLSCIIYPKEFWPIVKQVWMHTGNGISSRCAEFCLGALEDGFLVKEGKNDGTPSSQRFCKGPRRYRARETGATNHASTTEDGREYAQFIEERFGRNLSTSLADKAKLAVRRRISGVLTADVELNEALEKSSSPPSEGRMAGLTEDDVFLFPTGMSAIFTTHQILTAARGPMKSICFGFPYVDTLKILQKWGPGCVFYGHGSSNDLDNLESRLVQGERFLALFTELPGNPLLKSPDLKRVRSLADKYDFAVVVDETVGNFLNVNVLLYADVVVSSLTKIFSGDSNVMAGSAVINPRGRLYEPLRKNFALEYEDNLWAEDAVFLERNSRDFVSRIEKINVTAEATTALLKQTPLGKLGPSPLWLDRWILTENSERGLLSKV